MNLESQGPWRWGDPAASVSHSRVSTDLSQLVAELATDPNFHLATSHHFRKVEIDFFPHEKRWSLLHLFNSLLIYLLILLSLVSLNQGEIV